MSFAAAQLLEHHPVFHSQDAEETRAFLHGKGYKFDLPPRQAADLDACLNAIYMPNMYIAYLHYGSLPVELSPSLARNDYLVQLPIRGHLAANIGGESVESSCNRGVIASPVRERCHLVSSADSTRIQLALSQVALSGQLAALLGEPPDAPLDFAPAMDLAASYGRSLAQYVLMAVADLDRADSAFLNPITTSRFEQFVMTRLLLSHPNTYSDALRRRERSIAPRDVKRAIDYLEAHLDAPIMLADLVEVSGVPGRTLFQHFRDTKGTSPMRYLRDARLKKVREALLRAQPGERVTPIATGWGFSHLGRFSVEYRKRFSESPSETVERRDRHS